MGDVDKQKERLHEENDNEAKVEENNDEVKVMDTSTECTEEDGKTTSCIEELKRQIEQLKIERDEHLALAQRIQAEFDNFRKRNKNVSAEFYDLGVGDTVTAFLPVLDNLERALCSMKENDCSEAFIEGINMVKKQFEDVLKKLQVEEIKALGEPFDPELHHAVAQQDAQEEQEENTVVEVLQKGYKYKDKVLRYSMVKVAK
ncbi:MAG TPA: nucleotide exchange factor GrpE [Clostridiales bacterium]|nr:nucleotide exchange factor GrpE [Clostridiales bacterium]